MRSFLFLATLLLTAPTLVAQPLTTGTWTGTLDGPGPAQSVTVEIEECAEGLKLNLSSTDGRFRATDEILATSEATISFSIADTREHRTLACTTERHADGSLGGECRARRVLRDTRYRLALAPPARGTIGCSG